MAINAEKNRTKDLSNLMPEKARLMLCFSENNKANLFEFKEGEAEPF
jgi:hypothetical protein